MSSELNFSFDPAADIRPLLSPGESLLWSGVPKKGILLRRGDLFLIPFSLFWCTFIGFWEYMAFREDFMLGEITGMLFVLIGFYLAIGRFFADAWRRSGTAYGVTESRVIIVRPYPFSKSNESTSLKTINNLSFTQKSDGSGTLKFGSDIDAPAFAGFPKTTVNMGGQAFEMVPHVKDVYDIVSRQMNRKDVSETGN